MEAHHHHHHHQQQQEQQPLSRSDVLTLRINGWEGDGLHLDLPKWTTVRQLMHTLEQLTGVPVDAQRLAGLSQHVDIVSMQSTASFTSDSTSQTTAVAVDSTLEELGVRDHSVVRLLEPHSAGGDQGLPQLSHTMDCDQQQIAMEDQSSVDNGSDVVLVDLGAIVKLTASEEDENGTATTTAVDSILAHFFDGGPFDEAFDAAKRETRILMAVVYSRTDAQSLQYVTQLVTSRALLSLVAEHFVLWCGDASDADAMQSLARMAERNAAALSNTQASLLSLHTVPFTVLVSYLDNSISLIDTMPGIVSVDEVVSRLMGALEVYGPLLEADQERHEHMQIPVSDTQRLLLEQDRRYEETVQRDMELQRVREEEARRQAQQERDAALSREQQLARRQHMIQMLNEQRAIRREKLLPPEPAAGTADTTTLKFRLSDGSTVQRRFHLGDSLSAVFAFLDCEHHSNIYMLTVPQDDNNQEQPDENVSHHSESMGDHTGGALKVEVSDLVDEAFLQRQLDRRFELSTTWPRKTFRWDEEHSRMTLAQAGLRSIQLFVSEY